MNRWMALGVLLCSMGGLAQAAGEAVTVYQDPNCGCCRGWAEHLRESGFAVKIVDTQRMSAVKSRFGVPGHLASCHTAVMDESGQVIEGHVPARAIRKLLQQPDVKGVAAPGMPLNAPGMGELDGTLVTVDFAGHPFSQD